jgi:hypothetical protein
MLLNKRVSMISVIWSLLFVLVISLELIFMQFDISLYFIFSPIEILLGLPLYIFIFVSFLITGFTWLKNRNIVNFKYFIYTCISGALVVGTLIILMIMISDALESF